MTRRACGGLRLTKLREDHAHDATESEDQDDLLHGLAYPNGGSGWTGEAVTDPGHTHFEQLKTRIGVAYYNSQIGTRELGWDGAFAHGPYEGCTHPEGNHK